MIKGPEIHDMKMVSKFVEQDELLNWQIMILL
jgi:hypothetical protein